jgi:hypothetical protein
MTAVVSHNLSLENVDFSSFKLIELGLTHVVVGLAQAKIEAIVGILTDTDHG